MSELGIKQRLLGLLHLGGDEGGRTDSGPTTVVTPDVVRDPNMPANAALTPNAATNVPVHAPADLARVIEEVTKLLSTSAFDWAVTAKDAGKALASLASLVPGDRILAVEALGPDRLTVIDAKLRSSDRQRFQAVLDEIAAARNAPGGAPDEAAFLAHAHRALRGVLAQSIVTSAEARRIIDGLRRFDPAAQDRILDSLGPGKTQWLLSALSTQDQRIYAPTIARCRAAHFGAVARADAAAGLTPVDVTRRFLEILAKVERGEMKLDPEMHGKVTYYFVPGLVTEHQPGYFERNVQRLRDRGLRVEMSKIDTDADIETNASLIREEVGRISGGRKESVFVISHSKGGPDVRRAMQDEATDGLVFFWDAMQSACGTPVASTLMEGPLGAVIERALIDLFGAPNGGALKNLDFEHQKRLWIGTRPISAPILSLATSVGDHPSGLRGTSDIMHQRYGIASDGLVPLEEQKVGGKHAFAITLDGIDHAAPAARPAPGPFAPKHDPADLQEAQILLAYELAAAR